MNLDHPHNIITTNANTTHFIINQATVTSTRRNGDNNIATAGARPDFFCFKFFSLH
jgi:hypothetical protein